MSHISISGAFVDLVSSTDSERSNDLLLVINGETSGFNIGSDIAIVFNKRTYKTKVLDDETWFLNILNEDLIDIPSGDYIISASIGSVKSESHVSI